MRQLLYKILYNGTINYFLRNLNRAFCNIFSINYQICPSGELKIVNDEGKVLTLKTNQTNYVTHLIFWEGGYKKFEYTNIFISLVKKVNSFFDIGANIGYYSLVAAMENEKINIVGFEPALGPLYYFRKNVEINNFTNIKIEPIAISHNTDEIEFYEIRNKKYKYLEYNLSGESSTSSIHNKDNNFILNTVKSTTLDKYIIDNNVSDLDLIKIDTEGTEHLILSNAIQLIKKMKPIIICEILFNQNELHLENIMNSFNYLFYGHTDNGLINLKSITRNEDNGIRNCFFVHPDKIYLIEEFIIK